MLNRKVIMAIADGLGDRPHPLLGGKTPLEYARTPNLDRIASEGINGMMDLIAPGIPVGTDMGHLILFGYQPHHYPGRGPIEALGIGMNVKPGDIIFRCNFATVNENGIVVDRRAGRIREKTDELAQAISGLEVEGGVEIEFMPATEHRAVLILRGPGLSDKVSDSDPKAPNDGKPYHKVEPLDSSEEARRTANILNLVLETAHSILSSHPVNAERIANGKLPANFILTRGAGQMVDIVPVAQKLKINVSCIAGESTVLGVAKLAGYKTFTDSSMTGNIDTDIELKARLAIEEIADNDFVYVHMKAPDVKGHDNEPHEKVRSIELFDHMVGLICQQLPENVYIALAADHSTPCEVGEHTGEPVPIAIAGPSIRRDRILQYNEIDCAEGGLGNISGSDFVRTLHGLLGFVKKQGN
ncbi:2,3-bisphosphoglycerate-independent phosphoglycerate mutase [Bacillus massilinigeriensis]|uniref:2,3-bisphosphoglycerate-independent phosphoglycerate mutase n=1 Tax=Bacillus mediterraneensis TaxID=1805474 RepID=UPI0008F880C6|nr:2,3-bisphosphoglycerate-independent phosphoglycerate mutase [Bacillus mediterraneensis]